MGPVDQIQSIKKNKKKLKTHHTVAASVGTGASPWQRGGIGMWNLYTEPVSVKKELQLNTEPKEWQGQEVCEGECSERRQDATKQRQMAYVRKVITESQKATKRGNKRHLQISGWTEISQALYGLCLPSFVICYSSDCFEKTCLVVMIAGLT